MPLVLSGIAAAAPLRVLVTSDVAGVRDEYATVLKAAGARVTVAEVPDAAGLGQADVVMLHRREFAPLPEASRRALEEFAGRGGGMVAVHGAVAAGDARWGREMFGGGWDPGKSRRFESLMMLYVLTDDHPVVAGCSPFDLTEETVYDLELADKVQVLASAFTPKGRDGSVPENGRVRASIYDIQPQMWVHQGAKHRAMVLLQGAGEGMRHASIRAFILRGLAWAAGREKTDEWVPAADLADLRYPAGGPLRADKAIQQFRMQPGFVATVVAEEPMINKPIAIQWDGSGRLWVAETPEYPNGRRPLVAEPWKETGVLEPGNYDRPARDRISVLVDTDGDGKMDRKDLFHEGLELITGFQVYGQGVIAVAQPDIVYLADTDGDGKADVEKPLFGGFTPGDTHFVANSFILAPDGWIYASTGSGASVRDPGTKKQVAQISPGVFRFRPDGSAIEQVASQGGNSFGAEVTSDMEIFHSKATSGQPVQHVVLPEWVMAKASSTGLRSMESVNPGRRVARADLPDRAPIMQIDQVGRFSAACSVPVYEGGAWPDEYRDTIFMTEPILDVIHHERLVRKGPSFEGQLVLRDEEWLRSTDYWFCPVTVTFGPDGGMYVLDFYTPVVAHNDTRGPKHSRSNASIRPDRESYFGRIYRIQHESAPRFVHPDLGRSDAAGLVAVFEHPNRMVRANALRLLMEKSGAALEAAVPALRRMAAEGKTPPARIQALWTLGRMGKLDDALFAKAAADGDAGVRKNVMLIAEAGSRPLAAGQLKAALADGDERVRLAALRALGATALGKENAAVLVASLPALDNPWAKAAAAAAGMSNPVYLLESLLARPAGAAGAEAGAMAMSLAGAIAEGGDAEAVRRVLALAAKSGNTEMAVGVVEEIAKRARGGQGGNAADLRGLLASPNRALAAAVLPLAAAGKDPALKSDIVRTAGELMPVLRDAGAPLPRRLAALRGVIAAREADPRIFPAVLAMLKDASPAEFRGQVIGAVAATGEAAAGAALVGNFANFEPRQREAAFDAIVARPEWAMLWLDSLEQGKLGEDLLDPRSRARLLHHPDAAASRRAKVVFARLGGSGEAKEKVIRELLPVVRQPGDPAKGKATFAAACAICHQFQGSGQAFGPNLDGIGSHPVADLLTHIIDPSLVVDDEHRTWNFTMTNGTQYSGIIASENRARVQLRQPGGVVVELKAGDIATRQKADFSLMPEGFEALGAATLKDLITYIQSPAAKK